MCNSYIWLFEILTSTQNIMYNKFIHLVPIFDLHQKYNSKKIEKNSFLRRMARTFLTKSLIRSEYQYFAIQQKSEKVSHVKDVKNICFA